MESKKTNAFFSFCVILALAGIAFIGLMPATMTKIKNKTWEKIVAFETERTAKETESMNEMTREIAEHLKKLETMGPKTPEAKEENAAIERIQKKLADMRKMRIARNHGSY